MAELGSRGFRLHGVGGPDTGRARPIQVRAPLVSDISARTGVPLWSKRTAEEIVELLAQDIADGLLAADAGADLIHRVMERTQQGSRTAVHPSRLTPQPDANPGPARAPGELREMDKAG